MPKLIASLLMFFFMLGAAPAEKTAAPLHPAAKKVTEPYTLTIFVNFELVRHITCVDEQNNKSSGTGFMVGPTKMITAAHVVTDDVCWDTRSETPLTLKEYDDANDYAVMEADMGFHPQAQFMRVSCDGLKPKKIYDSIGFARGIALIMTHQKASKKKSPEGFVLSNGRDAVGLRLVFGDIIPGMSGGPIIDKDGVVVAINSATDGRGIGLVRELKDTSICPKKS